MEDLSALFDPGQEADDCSGSEVHAPASRNDRELYSYWLLIVFFSLLQWHIYVHIVECTRVYVLQIIAAAEVADLLECKNLGYVIMSPVRVSPGAYRSHGLEAAIIEFADGFSMGKAAGKRVW